MPDALFVTAALSLTVAVLARLALVAPPEHVRNYWGNARQSRERRLRLLVAVALLAGVGLLAYVGVSR